jgi:osmoprotectant transport system permease protein
MRHWLLALGLLAALGGAAVAQDDTLTVGSKRFTESYILAHVVEQTARPHARTRVIEGLGNTAIVYEALRAGRIDVYAEYLGTIDLEILRNAAPTSLDAMRRQLAPLGLGVDVPLGFNNGYAIAMRESVAARLNVRTLGDLAAQPQLRLALSNEFIGRADGWPGLKARYQLPHTPNGLDHGLAYQALADGKVDAIDIYTTDAKIAQLGLRVLDDDQRYFPRYDAVLLHRLDVPERFPAAWQALQRLRGSIDEAAMIGMNARAELQGASFAAIATERLRGTAPGASASALASAIAPGFIDRLFADDLGRLTLQHLGLVLGALALACAIGIPLAVAAANAPRARALLVGGAGVLQTVPSLAMLALLISWLGAIGTWPALVALTLYALLPIVRNTCTGLAEVPAGLRDAAVALGLGRADRLRHVELPLALPVIVAGVRTATVIAVGTATIAAFIGAGGYGERIVTGLALNDRALMLAGALPAALLALACEGAFALFERRVARRRGGVAGAAAD